MAMMIVPSLLTIAIKNNNDPSFRFHINHCQDNNNCYYQTNTNHNDHHFPSYPTRNNDSYFHQNQNRGKHHCAYGDPWYPQSHPIHLDLIMASLIKQTSNTMDLLKFLLSITNFSTLVNSVVSTFYPLLNFIMKNYFTPNKWRTTNLSWLIMAAWQQPIGKTYTIGCHS
jgi:hypothetical protein